MTLRIRALLGALVLAILAAAGALVLRYHVAPSGGQPGIDVATTGDLAGILDSADADGPQMAALALRKLEGSYYKPVDPQTLIDGERTALRGYLHSKKITNAAVPTANASGDVGQDAGRAADQLAYVQQHYASTLGRNGRSDLSEAALRGMLDSLKDPYTVYLSPREIQGLDESLSGGNFGGIGVYIYQLKDRRIVVQPIEQMPAARSGMKPGEVVDTVGGAPIRGLTLDRVEQLIRGEPGTTVHLTTHPYNAFNSRADVFDRPGNHSRSVGARENGERIRIRSAVGFRKNVGRRGAAGNSGWPSARCERVHSRPARQRRRPVGSRGKDLELIRRAGNDRFDDPPRRAALERRGAGDGHRRPRSAE